MHSSYSYVATSIIMSQHSFNAASLSWCRDPSFMSRQHLRSGYVATLFCIICISVATQKVCLDRGLLPLSLTSYCNLVMMLRHGLLVFVKYLLSRPNFLSRQDYSVFSLLILLRPSLLCSNGTSLLLCGNLCRGLKSLSQRSSAAT